MRQGPHRSNGTVSLAATLAAALLSGACLVPSAHADDDFFKGKTITIVNSTGQGGSYWDLAQAFARHTPKFIPGNPNIIVKSMPGAGNVLATNYLYNIAPKDGTTLGVINNSMPFHQVLDGRGVQFDAAKFNWLGSTGSFNSIAYVWHTAGIRTIKDLQEREVVLGGTGVGSGVVTYPTMMNAILGTKFKIVFGYKSTAEMDVAMERGEIQARTGSYATLLQEHPDWVKEKKVDIVAQIGSKRDKALLDVPLITELAKSEEDRQVLALISSPIAVGRPYLAPPGVPPERLAILRRALDLTLRDPAFLDGMSRLGYEVTPVSGEELAEIVRQTVNVSPDILARTRAAMGLQAR